VRARRGRFETGDKSLCCGTATVLPLCLKIEVEGRA
jgi:hypothetical protein